jgi:hypothetical protein
LSVRAQRSLAWIPHRNRRRFAMSLMNLTAHLQFLTTPPGIPLFKLEASALICASQTAPAQEPDRSSCRLATENLGWARPASTVTCSYSASTSPSARCPG